MNIKKFFRKIFHFFLHLRLQPIRVFCFHQVSDVFDPDGMWKCDWMSTVDFMKSVTELQEQYTFISLSEAHVHLCRDKIRLKKYAVLTADDGWASLKNIIPWLAEYNIPVTLFLNPEYLDGEHCRERDTEKYLTYDNVRELLVKYGSILTIASHGWSHKDCEKMTWDEFEFNVERTEFVLNKMKGKVSFFAFPYGSYEKHQIQFLNVHGLVPVLMDGMKNYDDSFCIHRELLD